MVPLPLSVKGGISSSSSRAVVDALARGFAVIRARSEYDSNLSALDISVVELVSTSPTCLNRIKVPATHRLLPGELGKRCSSSPVRPFRPLEYDL